MDHRDTLNPLSWSKNGEKKISANPQFGMVESLKTGILFMECACLQKKKKKKKTVRLWVWVSFLRALFIQF